MLFPSLADESAMLKVGALSSSVIVTIPESLVFAVFPEVTVPSIFKFSLGSSISSSFVITGTITVV